MELCGLKTLSRLLSEQPLKRFPEEEAAVFFVQLVRAVEYLHKEGISHRDLKLSNVLVDHDNKLKLIDFGFADNSQKNLKEFCGTPSYMAPELVLKVDYWGSFVDIWALGVILYRLLVGTFPFGSRCS